MASATSHNRRGVASSRVLVHADTEMAHEELVNPRLAYVSVSRGRYHAQIYTNHAQKLGEELSRDVPKQSALETEHETGGRGHGHEIEGPEHQSVSESHEHWQLRASDACVNGAATRNP